MTDPVAALRAEVLDLLVQAQAAAERAPEGGVIQHWWIGRQRGMETVLDLIDKQREGKQ